ncbi:MAG: transposase [Deltaproteobacteria bacterium]|nr:transposase [Deltaproteobacteria bacterium]
MSPSKQVRQTEFVFRSWGGKRPGAGRKPRGKLGGVPHRCRDELGRCLPVHVTLTMADWVYNLRSRRSFRVIEKALRLGADRFGVLIVELSVQGEHIHLMAEADDTVALGRAIKGLSVRIAKGLNRMMGRRGRVVRDRYHSRVLRTPRETRNVIRYIRENHRRHMAQVGKELPAGWVDPYSSCCPDLAVLLPSPRGWLVRASRQGGTS